MLRQGLTHFVFAKGTYTDGAAPVYSGAVAVDGAIRANLSLDKYGASIDADNGLYAIDDSITGGSISIEAAGITDEVMATMCGYEKGTGNGYKISDIQAPYGGFGYVVAVRGRAGVKHQAFIIHKVAFSQSGLEAATRSSSGGSFGTDTLDGKLMGHRLTADGGMSYIDVQTYDTEAAAIAAVNTALGLSA